MRHCSKSLRAIIQRLLLHCERIGSVLCRRRPPESPSGSRMPFQPRPRSRSQPRPPVTVTAHERQFSNELTRVSFHRHMFSSHCLLFVTPPLICLLFYLGPVALGITSRQVTSNCPAAEKMAQFQEPSLVGPFV